MMGKANSCRQFYQGREYASRRLASLTSRAHRNLLPRRISNKRFDGISRKVANDLKRPENGDQVDGAGD